MSGRSAFQFDLWLPAPLEKLEAFIHGAAFGLYFGSDFFLLIPFLLAPRERKSWKGKKKSHPRSCHGAACGVCLDAAAGRRVVPV